MLLTDEGCCGVGGASQDYAVFGAMEEGLISREGSRTLSHLVSATAPPDGGKWIQAVITGPAFCLDGEDPNKGSREFRFSIH